MSGDPVAVTGLQPWAGASADGPSLRVFVKGSQTPVLGTPHRTEDGIVFVPTFPFEQGHTYWVELSGSEAAQFSFHLPVVISPPPQVVAVWPDAPVLPATTLRFYVTFDSPARGRVSQQAVRLVADGHPVSPSPFMDFGQELWSPDGRRLTVLFDPGRIKRDVAAPDTERAPLIVGHRYALEIVGDATPYQYNFVVSSPVRTPLESRFWRITPPSATQAAIAISFDRVMDTALLADRLLVRATESRRTVTGRVLVDRGGRVWRFTPAEPWREGNYVVEVDPALEDASGNRIGEALDHPSGQADERPAPVQFMFRVDSPDSANRLTRPRH